MPDGVVTAFVSLIGLHVWWSKCLLNLPAHCETDFTFCLQFISEYDDRTVDLQRWPTPHPPWGSLATPTIQSTPDITTRSSTTPTTPPASYTPYCYHFTILTLKKKHCNSHHVVGKACLAQWFIHSISVTPTIVFLTQLPLNPLSKGATKGTKLELTWA